MSRGEGPAQQEQQQQDTEQHQQQEDPSPENVLAGLQVQEKNLRELRKYLFSRLFQLQVRRRCAEVLLGHRFSPFRPRARGTTQRGTARARLTAPSLPKFTLRVDPRAGRGGGAAV